MADHLFVWYTADRDSDSDAGCQSHLPLCCHTGCRWPLAPRFHSMPAEGKCAHLPSFVCGPTSNPHWTILLSPYWAKGHRPFAFERWSWKYLCGQFLWCVSECVLCVATRRGNESRSESSPVHLPVNWWRAEWEERWRQREKMIKRSCVFLSGHNGNPPSSMFSLIITERDGDKTRLVNEHILTNIYLFWRLNSVSGFHSNPMRVIFSPLLKWCI